MKRDWAKSFTNIILTDEKEALVILLSHRSDNLKDLKRKPVDREVLGIPGNPVTKFICDNCHYKGHRATNNRGNICLALGLKCVAWNLSMPITSKLSQR